MKKYHILIILLLSIFLCEEAEAKNTIPEWQVGFHHQKETIELPLEDIPPELAAEIQAHVESFNLGPILNDPLI